jgi:basic amino acid/polyamine antiporter, APA family
VISRVIEKSVESQPSEAVVVSRIGSKMPVGISAFGSWMLGVGTIIGSMAWLIHGPLLARAGTLPTLAAWTLAALMNLPLAFILAELSSMFPSAGGPYVYKYVALKRLFPAVGEFLGFATGWLYWVAMLTGMACMANGLAGLVIGTFWQDPAMAPKWFGSLVIALLCSVTTAMNLTRIQNVAKINNLFTCGKIALAVLFVGLVMLSPTASVSNILSRASVPDSSAFLASVMSVLVLSITAFSGIELVGCTSSETEQPTKNVPRAILLTVASVALIYIGIAIAICAASPYVHSADGSTMLIAGTKVQATCPSLAGFLGGKFCGAVFTAGVIVSIIACNFTAMLAMTRISYAMSETKLFPAQFSKLDARDSIPKDALWFLFACMTILSIGGNIAGQLIPSFDPYMFLGEVFGFLYACLAVLYGLSFISLRYTEPNLPRPFRLGRTGNAVAWIMAISASLVYGFVAIGCAQWNHRLTAAVLLFAAVPIYYFYRRKR